MRTASPVEYIGREWDSRRELHSVEMRLEMALKRFLVRKTRSSSMPVRCKKSGNLGADIDEHLVENHLHPNPPATCDFPPSVSLYTRRRQTRTSTELRPSPSPPPTTCSQLSGPDRAEPPVKSTRAVCHNGRPNAQPTNVNMKGRMVMLWKNKAAWKCDYLPGAILKAQWRSTDEIPANHGSDEARGEHARQQRRAQSRWDRRVCYNPAVQ
ncbi:hypothetical protein D9611_014072 [Ephemerocybe angulata]|uniref:Uncharacterized protein n=1 Tax=Ephemerocybe angulata TaxID=980116 RepID=A0A8H5ARP5_9AGAR|nr:hypothetical protein D9611_014072 [Tulosesus angulatus]